LDFGPSIFLESKQCANATSMGQLFNFRDLIPIDLNELFVIFRVLCESVIKLCIMTIIGLFLHMFVLMVILTEDN